MPLNRFFKRSWRNFRERLSIVDVIFLSLRGITIIGGVAWLALAPLSGQEARSLFLVILSFTAYSLLLFLLIWHWPERIRQIYILSLVLDIIFVFHLADFKPSFDNSFFLGYYLLTALHTFYFGLRFGLLVGTMSAILYLINISHYPGHIHWTDLALRVSFLYLIAIPLGLLSEKLRSDKEEIEKLNRRLEDSLENLKRVQKKLIEAEKLSALGRLTADIAHEIRNPLAALGGMARRLDRTIPEGAREKEYVKVILSEAARLESILRDILVLSSEGYLDLERGDVTAPVKEAVSFFCDLCSQGKIEIRERYQPGLPHVYLDHESVKQAVGNLITNAIDAILPDGGTITVETGTEFTNEVQWVIVSVSDTGWGIPEDRLEFIFEPFYSTKKIGIGTGLGLSIVREIMEEHRGFVRVKSSVEKGSTFTLYFPYQPEEDDKKIPCWEFMKCGIEKDPSRRCPAYPYFGRICWAIAGTLCEGRVMGTYAQKIEECHHCPFYKECHRHRDTSQ